MIWRSAAQYLQCAIFCDFFPSGDKKVWCLEGGNVTAFRQRWAFLSEIVEPFFDTENDGMFAYEMRLDWQAFYEFDTFMTIRLSLDPYFHQSETETRWILFNKFPDDVAFT